MRPDCNPWGSSGLSGLSPGHSRTWELSVCVRSSLVELQRGAHAGSDAVQTQALSLLAGASGLQSVGVQWPQRPISRAQQNMGAQCMCSIIFGRATKGSSCRQRCRADTGLEFVGWCVRIAMRDGSSVYVFAQLWLSYRGAHAGSDAVQTQALSLLAGASGLQSVGVQWPQRSISRTQQNMGAQCMCSIIFGRATKGSSCRQRCRADAGFESVGWCVRIAIRGGPVASAVYLPDTAEHGSSVYVFDHLWSSYKGELTQAAMPCRHRL